MKKRSLSLVLALLMLLCLISGCGQKAEETPAAPPSAEPAGAPEEAADAAPPEEPTASPADVPAGDAWILEYPGQLPITEEPYTLTMYNTFSPELYEAASDPMTTEGMMALQEATGVEVEYMLGAYNDATIQFNVICASGEYPDILPDVAMNYTGGLTKAYEDGIIEDMTDIIAEYMPCYDYYINTSDEYMLAAVNDDGLMLEAAQFQVSRQVVLGPFIRQDWLEDVGMDASEIVTYDDYYNALTAFKNNGHPNALMIGVTGVPEYNYLAAGYGIAADLSLYGKQKPFMNVDGTVKYGPLEDGYLDYIEMMNKWYSEDLIYTDFMTQEYPMTTFGGAGSGQLGLVYAYTAFIDIFKSQSTDEDFHMVGIRDAVQNESDILHLRRDSDAYEMRGKSITTTCKDVETVARWIDYTYSYEGYLLTNYGIEGKTYEASSIPLDVNPKLTELSYANPEGYTLQQSQFIYCANCSSLPANADDEQLWADEIVAATEMWAEYSDNAYCLPVSMAPTSEESEEFASLYADIETYVTEWQLNAILGNTGLDTYEDMVARIESMGIGRCIEIYQDALDRCLARLG